MAGANIHDVAAAAGVSHATVTRFFKSPDLLSTHTRKRVEQAVKELRYVPNAAVRGLFGGQSGLIALVVADITSVFYTTLMQGVEATAQGAGYSLILVNTDESPTKEQKLLRSLVAHRVDGIILTPADGAVDSLELVKAHEIPVVLADREKPDAKLDTVLGDSYEGGRLMTHHLVVQGCTDIAFVGGPPGISSLEQRLSGYRQVIADHGLEPRVYLGQYSVQSGEEIMERLVAEEALPDAVVAASNKVALGILTSARRHGIRIPETMGLVCMDDVESASVIDPFLTVANQPAYDIGRIAMKTLMERIEGADFPPRKVVLPVELIVRRSSQVLSLKDG